MKINPIISTLFSSLVMLLFFACQSPIQKSDANPDSEPHPSGAAYSLDYFTHMRTYPDGKLHRKKYELAFQQKQLTAAARDGGEDEL